MAQIRLKNSSGRYSVIGQQVKLAPNSKTSFVVAELGDFGIIGTVAESVPNTYSCVINLINTVTWADVLDKSSTGVTLEAVKADTDIASALSLKHSNSTDHASGSDNQTSASLLSSSLALTGRVADIADTNFTVNTAGLYRIGFYLVDTIADITAGAVTLHIKYTDSGGARDIASSPVVLSALTGFAQGEVIVQLASGTTTYGVTHSGIFGTATYALFLTQERLQ